ncbi:MAG: terpene cyclase/mutase family protein [Thermoleophilia bacterium]|nr:terpene cyclase/mutase family protein [Thermoleophilia bacterium]
MKALAVMAAAVALAVPARLTPLEAAAAYIATRQQTDGGFAERDRSDPSLTAWAVLALRAARSDRVDSRRVVAYLREQPYPTANDLALRVLALDALGEETRALADRLAGLRRADGRIGPLVNSTAWSVIALRTVGRAAPATSVRYLLTRQHRSGGWSWAPQGAPDSNDTAAVVQALRAAGVRGRPIGRALAYLRRLQAHSGGFRLLPGREPDAQSTAWAIQAFLAAGQRPPRGAHRFLLSLYRGDGTFRYSRRYVATPAIVTAQVVPALAGTPFPLR